MSRSHETRTKRKASPIDSWEGGLNRVLRNPAISEETVRSVIRDDGVLNDKVSLRCPLGRGSRIEIPVRTTNCKHLQCFDLATFLKMHDRKILAVTRHGEKLVGDAKSPICQKQAEVGDLHVDGYFASMLRAYKDLQTVEEVEIASDGSHRPIVRPKVEVFPVSDSPFIRADGGEKPIDEKPLAAHQAPCDLENADEEEVSAEAMDITDLDLDKIRRLPETHQLCNAVKRKLLTQFKRTAKKSAINGEPSTPVLTVTTRMPEGSVSSSADDAHLLSGVAEEQAEKLQAEVEQLRKALVDRDRANMELQAQNEQLQADLLNRKETISANEQEKAKLQLEKQKLDTEKEALHLKLESLTAEQAQCVAVVEEKAKPLQEENSKLQEAKLHECDFNSTSMVTLHDNTLDAADIPRCNVGNPNPRTEIPLNRRRFTKEVSFESENGEGMSDTFFAFPCSDRSIRRRFERQIVESALLEKLRAFVRIEVGKLVAHFRDKPTSGVAKHWLITDMLLKGLDEMVVDRRSTLITRIEFPQMPIWIKNVVRDLDGLAVDVTPTHVFLCVGFDLAICSNQNSPEHVSGVIVGQIERIIEWWEAYVVGKMIDRMCVSMPCKVKLPRFVLFTIPEVGDWNNTWRLVNEHYREWAADHNRRRRHPAVVHTVRILDWAKMCKDKWGNENGTRRISTFEERVKLLMEHCNSEYGMLLERNNVDMAPRE